MQSPYATCLGRVDHDLRRDAIRQSAESKGDRVEEQAGTHEGPHNIKSSKLRPGVHRIVRALPLRPDTVSFPARLVLS